MTAIDRAIRQIIIMKRRERTWVSFYLNVFQSIKIWDSYTNTWEENNYISQQHFQKEKRKIIGKIIEEGCELRE